MAALNRTGFFILIRRTTAFVKENVSNAFINVRCLLAKTNFKLIRTTAFVKENVSNAFINVRCLLAKTNFKLI